MTRDANLPVNPNELARRAQLGSVESLEALVVHFRPRLIFLLTKRLIGTGIDAEDIVQEALVKACMQIHTFNPKYQFSTWVFTIAIRTSMDAVRKMKRAPRRIDFALDQFETRSNPTMEDSECHDRIWSIAKESLPSAQFEVLWLRFGEELGIPEVANILGRTQVGVRVLLHRARTKLHSVLKLPDAMSKPNSWQDDNTIECTDAVFEGSRDN